MIKCVIQWSTCYSRMWLSRYSLGRNIQMKWYIPSDRRCAFALIPLTCVWLSLAVNFFLNIICCFFTCLVFSMVCLWRYLWWKDFDIQMFCCLWVLWPHLSAYALLLSSFHGMFLTPLIKTSLQKHYDILFPRSPIQWLLIFCRVELLLI